MKDKDFYVLGLNLGHNSTACLSKNGKIVGCVSEERFNRKKNTTDFPLSSIIWLLNKESIEINDIDYVVSDNYYEIINDYDMSEHLMDSYNKSGRRLKYEISKTQEYIDIRPIKNYIKLRDGDKVYHKIRQSISDILNFDINRIILIDHHLAHAYSCISFIDGKSTLIFTLDGEGSNKSGSINIYRKSKIENLLNIPKESSFGYLFCALTNYLNMKPLEHEYKLMGLAGYVNDTMIDKYYHRVKNIITINDDLTISTAFNTYYFDQYIKENLSDIRFDILSGVVQRLLEEKVIEWISKAMDRYHLYDIAVSGGVFMNVKLNQKISELKQLKSLTIVPSSGDESNAIGCCNYGNMINDVKPSKIENLYLGGEHNDSYLESAMAIFDLKRRCTVIKYDDINVKIAELLDRGEIIGVFRGRNEFGARALGNRSIVARADSIRIVNKLNNMIKNRDFWMPFTPSMLEEDKNRYLKYNRKVKANFMLVTFKIKEDKYADMNGVIHQYDKTARPQLVTKKMNPVYYDLLKKYKKISGNGLVLNTSFNLHGEPIVHSPEDAISTFLRSGLKYLCINNHLFTKKGVKDD